MFIFQTPPTFCIKSPPTTPVKPVVTASQRKGKPAAAVSPVPAAASDSSATTDISVNEDNAPAVVRFTSLWQTQLKVIIQGFCIAHTFLPPCLQTAKAVKQKKSPVTPKQARSRKDSPGANNKVGTAAKKQVSLKVNYLLTDPFYHIPSFLSFIVLLIKCVLSLLGPDSQEERWKQLEHCSIISS